MCFGCCIIAYSRNGRKLNFRVHAFFLALRLRFYVVLVRIMTGKDIQTWRKSKRLSVQQVADHIGISHRTLQGWESGRFSIPGPKQKRVAELLRKEAVAMKIDADTFAKLAAKAKEKGFPSAESFANDLLSKLLIAVIFAAPLWGAENAPWNIGRLGRAHRSKSRRRVR